jgi:hypothetical protein
MNKEQLNSILKRLKDGNLSVDEAAILIHNLQPIDAIGSTKLERPNMPQRLEPRSSTGSGCVY